jgi:hypothetical protein
MGNIMKRVQKKLLEMHFSIGQFGIFFPRISKLKGEEPLIFVHHIGEIREKLLRSSRRFYSD